MTDEEKIMTLNQAIQALTEVNNKLAAENVQLRNETMRLKEAGKTPEEAEKKLAEKATPTSLLSTEEDEYNDRKPAQICHKEILDYPPLYYELLRSALAGSEMIF